MALRFSLFAVPTIVVAMLALLLDVIDASPSVVVATLGTAAVSGGALLGYFAEQLPKLRLPREPRAEGRSRAGAHPAARH